MATNSKADGQQAEPAASTEGSGTVGSLFSKSRRLPPASERQISVVPDPQPGQPPANPTPATAVPTDPTEPAAVEASAAGAPFADPDSTGAADRSGAEASAAPAQPNSDPVHPGVASPAATKPKPAQRKSRGPRKGATEAKGAPQSAPAAAGVPENVAFRVPPAVRDALHARRKAAKASLTDIVLDAIALHVDEIQDQLSAQRPAQRTGGLFSRVYTQRPVTEPDRTETNVQVNIRLYPDDLATLEDLWVKAGARDRSHYIATALRIHLEIGDQAASGRAAARQ